MVDFARGCPDRPRRDGHHDAAAGQPPGLSTARAALQVTWLLAARPEGVRADHVAEMLGKSVSTAYNLLASLCDEGVAERTPGGVYRLAPGFRDTVAPAPRASPSSTTSPASSPTSSRAPTSARTSR